MEVGFESKQLATACSDTKTSVKTFGPERSRKVRRRLQQLLAAANLEDLRNAPGRCHELQSNRRGQLSLDLDGPYRLIFRPAADPPPTKNDGGLDWPSVESIVIIEIADTHK